MDPALLARIQFGFTISFHIIFPSFTIGLAAYIATLLVLILLSGSTSRRRLGVPAALGTAYDRERR